MCVERTASTKVPSARASRDMVARQKRAAALGGMCEPDCILLCLRIAILINKLKVAQRQKQIYPQTFVNVMAVFEAPESSRNAGVAGRWTGLASQASAASETADGTAGAGLRCGAVITNSTAAKIMAAA